MCVWISYAEAIAKEAEIILYQREFIRSFARSERREFAFTEAARRVSLTLDDVQRVELVSFGIDSNINPYPTTQETIDNYIQMVLRYCSDLRPRIAI